PYESRLAAIVGHVLRTCRLLVRSFNPISLDVRLELVLAYFELLVRLRGLANLHRVILARRMPFPIFRHQQPTQVWMSVEDDAEHVPRFALEPAGAFPHSLHR